MFAKILVNPRYGLSYTTNMFLLVLILLPDLAEVEVSRKLAQDILLREVHEKNDSRIKNFKKYSKPQKYHFWDFVSVSWHLWNWFVFVRKIYICFRHNPSVEATSSQFLRHVVDFPCSKSALFVWNVPKVSASEFFEKVPRFDFWPWYLSAP